jgi:hypothetical protein
VYEVVWGVALDPRNFHRKVTGTADLLEPTGTTTTRAGGRPAMVHRRGTAALLMPPLLRPGPPEGPPGGRETALALPWEKSVEPAARGLRQIGTQSPGGRP